MPAEQVIELVHRGSESGANSPNASAGPAIPIVDEEPVYEAFVNMPVTSKYRYPDNYIRTTKYTILTFLPVNLFNQVCFRYL